MTKPALVDELARLDDEILHLQQRATDASAGLAEHIVLEAARRMRGAIAGELAPPSATRPTRQIRPR